MLPGIAPTLLVNIRQRRVVRTLWPFYELDTIAIDHLPIRLECFESIMLLVPSGVHHDRPPISQHAYDPLPEPIA